MASCGGKEAGREEAERDDGDAVGGVVVGYRALRRMASRMFAPLVGEPVRVGGGSGAGGLPALLAAAWIFVGATGTIAPNTFAAALTRHGGRAGSATAVLEFLQQGTAALVSLFVAVLGGGSSATATVILATAVATLALLSLGTPVYRPERAGARGSVG